jgi:hypothetical protein
VQSVEDLAGDLPDRAIVGHDDIAEVQTDLLAVLLRLLHDLGRGAKRRRSVTTDPAEGVNFQPMGKGAGSRFGRC